jgi:hypothetical protein
VKSSENSCNSLVLELRPQRWPSWYLLVLASCMMSSVGLAGLEPGWKVGLWLVILVWVVLTWNGHRPGLKMLVWKGAGQWRLQSVNGRWLAARLLRAWSPGPAIGVLFWRDELGRKRWLLVTPGAASEAARRHLACHLRWRAEAVQGVLRDDKPANC